MQNKWINFYNSNKFNVLLFIIFFMLPILIWLPTILSGYLFVSGDGVGYFSSRLFFTNSLLSGEFSLWNPYAASGAPIISEPGISASDTFLKLPTLILGFLPGEIYVLTYYALYLSIGAFFTYLYLKAIGVNKPTAIMIALAYELSIHIGGYRKSHIVLITSIVILPMILYFIERYFTTKNLKYFILTAVAIAIQFPSIQLAVYTCILLLFYICIGAYKNRLPIKLFFKDAIISGIIFLGLIAIFILPLYHLLSVYKSYGAIDPGIEYFKAHASALSNIFYLLDPRLFAGPIDVGSGYEIYIGTILSTFMIYGAIKFFKDYRIKFAVVVLLVTWIFSSHPSIPYLSEILYNIPLINGFRVPSRVLLIFIFFSFTIVAITISKLIDEKKVLTALKDIAKFTVVVLILTGVFFVVNKIYPINLIQQGKIVSKILIASIIIKSLLATLILLFLYYYASHKKNHFHKIFYVIFIVLIFIVTQSQVLKHSLIASKSPTSNIEEKSGYNKEFGLNKIWVASPQLEYLHVFFGSNNTQLKILTINSYTAFNNPRLYRIFNDGIIPQYNSTGLFMSYPQAYDKLLRHNDLLSMLGIKYIVDPQNYIDNSTTLQSISYDANTKEYYSNDNLTMQDIENNLLLFQDKISLANNEFYMIDIEATANKKPTMFYLDFWGIPDYDRYEQDISFEIKQGKNKYSKLISTGTVPKDIETYVRLIASNDTDIKVLSLKLTKLPAPTIPSPYQYYREMDGYPSYINTNAKEILYTPKYIKNIDDVEDIYVKLYKYNLIDSSYIENLEAEKDIANVSTKIEITDFSNNQITVKVSADNDTYINFSQTYFPGWVGYVDGKKIKVDMVNGLIMGIPVPKGEHIIKFKFTSPTFTVGAIISILTLIIVILLVIRLSRKEKLK